MARPAKSAKLLTKKSQTKEEISRRASAEAALRGSDKRLTPPKFLTENQRKLFKTIAKMLQNADILGAPDVYLLTQCAISIDRLHTLEGMINENPALITDGGVLSAKDKYTKDFFRCCNELSLSPQSRAKLGNLDLQKQQQSSDPVLQLLKGGAER